MATQLSNACADGQVDEDLMNALQKDFSDEQIVEMAIVTAVLVGMAKMLFAMNWAERSNACPIGHWEETEQFGLRCR
jgi:uncharacterized membrane protein